MATTTLSLQEHYSRETRLNYKDDSGNFTSDYTKWLENKIYKMYYRTQVTDKINGKKIAAFTNALKTFDCSVFSKDWIDSTLDHIAKTKLSYEEKQAIRKRIGLL